MPHLYPVSHPLSWALQGEGPTSLLGAPCGGRSLVIYLSYLLLLPTALLCRVPQPHHLRSCNVSGPAAAGDGGRPSATPLPEGGALGAPGGGGPHPLFPSPFPPSGGRGEKCAAQGSALGGRKGIGEVR